jgi:hypothetical protein
VEYFHYVLFIQIFWGLVATKNSSGKRLI